jgi:hypothetical protein
LSYGTFTGDPYTDFGGYTNTWPGEWGASIDVYLDPAWAVGKGFNYTVATNNSSGAQLREFAFHAAKDADSGTLLVAASNDSPASVLTAIETLPTAEITAAGWYTIRHTFKDNGGVLEGTVELLPQGGGAAVLTRTLTGNDPIASVGGNRYGWFTDIDVDGGLQADNVAKLGAPTGSSGPTVLAGGSAPTGPAGPPPVVAQRQHRRRVRTTQRPAQPPTT